MATIGGRYTLGKKLGAGSFGNIYEAKDISTGTVLAVKIEDLRKVKSSTLFYERQWLQLLQGGDGVVKLHYFEQGRQCNVMVTDLLGLSLADLFDACNEHFGLGTTCMCAIQMITRIEYLHSKNCLHRDIKPDNFLVGIGANVSKIYIIDFGLCKKYMTKNGEHVPWKEGKELTGTARYVSTFTHQGLEQSRRDDLESLGHVLVYFMQGKLPWQGLKAENKRLKNQCIGDVKQNTPLEELCKGLPNEFIEYLRYCRNLKFEEKPDYSYMRGLFEQIMKRENLEFDYIYDWNGMDTRRRSTVPDAALGKLREDFETCKKWIEAVIGGKVQAQIGALDKTFADGVTLCTLLGKLDPRLKTDLTGDSAKNSQHFVHGCQKLGLLDEKLFAPVELTGAGEGEQQIVECLQALMQIAIKKGLPKPPSKGLCACLPCCGAKKYAGANQL